MPQIVVVEHDIVTYANYIPYCEYIICANKILIPSLFTISPHKHILRWTVNTN